MAVDRKHIMNLSGREFVKFEGLLALGHELGLDGVESQMVQAPTAENGQTCIMHATITMKGGRTFSAHGDANPGNVSGAVKPHLIRMADTRAIARALRLATNVGITAYEELAEADLAPEDGAPRRTSAAPAEPPAASAEQLKKIAIGLQHLGWSEQAEDEYLVRKYGRTSKRDLNEAQAGEFLEYLRDLARKAAA